MKIAESRYRELKDFYQEKIRKQTMVVNTISNLRLLAFLIGLAVGVYFVVNKNFLGLAIDIGVFIVLFLPMVILHDAFLKKRRYSTAFYKINKVSLMRIKGEWNGFLDDGAEFIDESHHYSQDLDIFGEGSLFQYINTAITFLGRKRLAEILTTVDNRDVIVSRRNAVFELADKLKWRQEFQAEGRLEAEQMHDPQELFDWAEDESPVYRNPMLYLLVWITPFLTAGVGVYTLLQPVKNYLPLIIALLIQTVAVYGKFRKRAEVLDTTYRYMKNIRVYSELIARFEEEEFGSNYLNGLQKGLKNTAGRTASEQIGKLVRLVDMISNRSSEIYVVFNVLFLLDFHFMFALERWKSRSGKHIENWLLTVAELEALNSLAVLRYDHPDWATPDLVAGDPVIQSKKLGHPLLIDKCIRNDLNFSDVHTILLITGSNMSGKSTLLRTAGINLVLAYAGAPVCAESFRCSVMEVFSCMRVHDNLEKNISSFTQSSSESRCWCRASKKESRFSSCWMRSLREQTPETDTRAPGC